MTDLTRRELIASGALSVTVGALASANVSAASLSWAKGIEGQRKTDLGNGTFLNPIVAGDFLSLRPGIYAAGNGAVRVRNVRYEAL